MKLAHSGLLAGAAVLALGATVVIFSDRGTPQRRRSTNVASVVRETRDNEVVEERLRRLEQRIATLAAAPAPTAAAAVDGSEAETVPEADEYDAEGKKLSGPDRALEQSRRRYEQEAVDDQWSEETTTQLSNLMETIPGAGLVSADCRQSVCRIETRYDSAEAADAFDLRMIEMSFMKNTRGQMRDVTDAEGRRTGHELFVGRLQENRKSVPR